MYVLQKISFHPKAKKGNIGSVGAPMPGEVIQIKVKAGDKVIKGDSLIIVSAMKMEMAVSAPMNGIIKEVLVEVGMKMAGDDLLVEMEE